MAKNRNQTSNNQQNKSIKIKIVEKISDIKIKDYAYDLPESKIAKYPLDNRANSKLLHFQNNKIVTDKFENITNLLNSNDSLFFNNAKVIQARLLFQKTTGANIEIFCLKPYNPIDYNLSFQATESCEWECLVHNLKKWKSGSLTKNIIVNNEEYVIEAEKKSRKDNSIIVEFSWHNSQNNSEKPTISFADILENIGETPLPPYLNRKAEKDDKIRYQTVYAKQEGSVAAPTAGLHFTKSIMDKLQTQNIDLQYITLHVGAGTFRPVKSESIAEHNMHSEDFEIKYELLEHLLNRKGRIIAVGTTTVRTLESLYWIGVKLINKNEDSFRIKQWEVYEKKQEISLQNSLSAIKDYMNAHNLTTLQASTEIIIVPTYKFKVINALITNFHQPQSTLLLLIAAILGEKWKEVYQYALQNDYRFLSYGDSSFFEI